MMVPSCDTPRDKPPPAVVRGTSTPVSTALKTGEMQIPFFKEMKIGAYLLKQKLLGRKRYPLVLMLEPLFRCNLACVGAARSIIPSRSSIDRLSVDECLAAVDEVRRARWSLSRAANR